MPNHALLLEYEGTAFHGFQKQKNSNLPTVQGELEKSLKIILREEVKIIAAGRTDAGVHARGMVINFHSKNQIQNYSKLNLSLNAVSNNKVSVLNSCEASETFHARFSCTEREYEYLIQNSSVPHPLFLNKTYHYKKKIDIDKLKELAHKLEGVHDFASFTKAESKKKYSSTIRRIDSIKISVDSEFSYLIKIKIKGSGFLHNMVRITIGTLIDTSSNKLKMDIEEILKKQDRVHAGVTLPAYALYFCKAYYKDFQEIESLYTI